MCTVHLNAVKVSFSIIRLLDPFQLIPCRVFGKERQEPFQVIVCAEALLIMDMVGTHIYTYLIKQQCSRMNTQTELSVWVVYQGLRAQCLCVCIFTQHAHVSMGEVIGLLGGSYSEEDKVLKVIPPPW